MEAQVDTLHLLAQPKGQQQLKNRKQPELTENQTVWKSDNKEMKMTHSPRPVGGAETGSRAERTLLGVAAGRPSRVADCGMGQAVLQLADPAAPHSHTDKLGGTQGEQSGLHNRGLQLGEIKPQTSD